MDFVKWVGKFTVTQKRLIESWLDFLDGPAGIPKENVVAQHAASLANGHLIMDPSDGRVLMPGRTVNIPNTDVPLGPNLFALIFIVVNDIPRVQSAQLQGTLSLR